MALFVGVEKAPMLVGDDVGVSVLEPHAVDLTAEGLTTCAADAGLREAANAVPEETVAASWPSALPAMVRPIPRSKTDAGLSSIFI